jgi:hypothetical protein
VGHPALQRPPQLLDRVLPVPHQRALRDVEAGDLGLAAVEAGDRVGVDCSAEVGDELAGRCGQLAQVVADGLDDRADGVHGDPAAERADLVADEVRQVARRPELGALVDGGAGLLERLDQGLVALAAVVDQHERQLGIGILGVGDKRVVQRPRGFLHTGDHDQPVAAEEGRRQDVGQLPHR